MQKTEKLGMNLFESGDPVLAESFNENTNILEAALSKQVRMVTGSYVGDSTADRVLTFESKPLFLVFHITGSPYIGYIFCMNGTTTGLYHTTGNACGTPNIAWDNETNSVTLKDAGYFSNYGATYTYLAFLEK